MRSVLEFALKAALFLLLANIVMLFIVDFGTAEWYITVVSVGLMLLLSVIVLLMIKKLDKEKK